MGLIDFLSNPPAPRLLLACSSPALPANATQSGSRPGSFIDRAQSILVSNHRSGGRTLGQAKVLGLGASARPGFGDPRAGQFGQARQPGSWGGPGFASKHWFVGQNTVLATC